jgi:hypothetical protein
MATNSVSLITFTIISFTVLNFTTRAWVLFAIITMFETGGTDTLPITTGVTVNTSGIAIRMGFTTGSLS